MSNSSRKTGSRGKGAIAFPVMPDKTITVLSLLASFIAIVYVVLVIVTVSLATWQTSLASGVRETEGSIATLETTYYASISVLNATNPHAVGYVSPSDVRYAEARPPAGLSLAR